MADNVLSMSLDEIIRLQRRGGGSENRQRTNIGARGNGARGASYQVRTGRARVTGPRAQIRKRGGMTQVGNTNNRGRNWNRGSNIVRGRLARYRNSNQNRQRQYQIALGRSKLQMAKRFLRMRQRGRNSGIMAPRNSSLTPRLSVRGVRGQRFRRGRIGVQSPRLIPNSFRSDQLLRLSRLNTYRNKINRKLSANSRNQEGAGPSLIVSIENDRAGMSSIPNARMRGRRRGGLTGTMRQAYGRAPTMSYQPRSTVPFHTGRLNPEIQMVIAGIQGKSNYGASNPGARRGTTRGRGFGGFSRRGRTQVPMSYGDNSRRQGLPLGVTGNTLNERFSGLR